LKSVDLLPTQIEGRTFFNKYGDDLGKFGREEGARSGAESGPYFRVFEGTGTGALLGKG